MSSSSAAAAAATMPTSPAHACPTSPVRDMPTSASKQDTAAITAGDHVVVHGLQKAHELNGRRGRVDGYRGQRCIVCVSGSKKLVLPINLRRVAAGPIAGASTAPVDSDSSGASTMRQPHSSLSDDSSSSDDEPDSAPPSAALAARPSFMTARGGTAAVSRVRARDDDPEDDDDQGLGSASALRGGGFISASQSKGTVRPRSTTAGWNGRQNQCGVFMNARAERVHISEESRRKGAEIWEKEIAHLFDDLSCESDSVTAATAGPEWSTAQIMSLEGEDRGRMRTASVPPAPAAAAAGSIPTAAPEE